MWISALFELARGIVEKGFKRKPPPTLDETLASHHDRVQRDEKRTKALIDKKFK